MNIRTMRPEDLPGVIRLWNGCVEAGDVLYAPLTEEYFNRKFVQNEGCEPDNLLVAEEDGRIIGMAHGVAPETFRGAQPGIAYLTCLMVDAPFRGRGAGKALLEEMKKRMLARGAQTLLVSSANPVNLDWRIPDTPGHDHNNMPGVDNGCAGFGFFGHNHFEPRYQAVSMYTDLSGFHLSPRILSLRAKLAEEGIRIGPYDHRLNCDFDALCDHVGSEYWRDVLRTEIIAWKCGRPNDDPRMWPDGVRPQGPRTLLTAVHNGRIVAFTGPVDLQKSGRGWFTGICTDPEYERRGIATVLFHLLMQAFYEEGARFSTLFTGAENHAQKIYLNAGLRPVRQFTLMALPLKGEAS